MVDRLIAVTAAFLLGLVLAFSFTALYLSVADIRIVGGKECQEDEVLTNIQEYPGPYTCMNIEEFASEIVCRNPAKWYVERSACRMMKLDKALEEYGG